MAYVHFLGGGDHEAVNANSGCLVGSIAVSVSSADHASMAVALASLGA